MTYVSVCSGIEAASVAWHPLGWVPVAFAEIEPFPCSVLAERWPGVPNLGDMTKVDWSAWRGKADVLIGGTPCQSFSVAGLRKSLSDERGNLALEFCRAADAIRPRYIIWENVPGVLSTDDNAFGCFLAGLVGAPSAIVPEPDTPKSRRWSSWRRAIHKRRDADGKWIVLKWGRERRKCSWSRAGVVDGPLRSAAWRILDAQYVGLAQRRERVFVIASSGDGDHPAEILFEWEGLRRDSPPSREAGEGVTGSLAARATAGGGLGTDFDCGGGLIANTLRKNADSFGGQHGSGAFITHALKGEGFDASEDGTGRGVPLVPISVGLGSDVLYAENLAQPVTGRNGDPGVVAFDTTQVTSKANRSNPQPGDPCHPLAAGADAPLIAFSSKDHGADAGEIAPTLRAMTHDGSHANGGGQVAVVFQSKASASQSMNPSEVAPSMDVGKSDGLAIAFEPRFARNGRGAPDEITSPLKAESGKTGKGDGATCVATGYAVRRLTPAEAESLQGFSRGYTLVTHRGKPAADGPRYKALGNSMAVPVVRWLAERIEAAR